MRKKAFTLIELLIVIALLGALAVGLLAALDPFEQLKKGTDTGVRNTVSEVHGAIIRYYAVKGNMPWESNSIGPIDLSSGYNTVGLQKIVETGELKSDFSTLAGGDRLRKITVIGTKESVTVCFRPESKSFRSDPNTKYNASGGEVGTGANNCGATNSNTFSCYWCVK
jgi:prepilin-type N-terminal cleavage/methylation domain-containing protein